MKFNPAALSGLALLALAVGGASLTACSTDAKTDQAEAKSDDKGGPGVGGPQLGTPGGGPVNDKSGDTTLQRMIAEVVPQFRQLEFVDGETGDTIHYNLFVPKDINPAKTYPLVLFMADASTPGTDVTRPLTQGYGALVWATASSQAQNPSYVLVPQFSGVAVNDAYERTPQVDAIIRLLNSVVADNNVDVKRLYTTGQSMGGMISMYFNIAYPEVFAASMFVDCHWDTSKFPELVNKKFAYVTAGRSGKSAGDVDALRQICEKDGVKCAFAEWSAKLPATEQDSLAASILAGGAPINIVTFTPGSVLPDDGQGSEHMYSFDYAYKLTSIREWLFRQSK